MDSRERFDLDPSERRLFPDFEPLHFDIMRQVSNFTMTSPERIHALIEAVRYLHRRSIPGSIVECGVWRGGSVMVAAYMLQFLGDLSRDLWLFDTFEGMPPPTAIDVTYHGYAASEGLAKSEPTDELGAWCYASLETVKHNLARTGYPVDRLHFVQGNVLDTVPANAPEQIALLRLDTDWYQSTKHELTQLYPRLSSGGVLIIDDYGHWQGQQQGVDEFIAATPDFGLLSRIDYAGRLSIKL